MATPVSPGLSTVNQIRSKIRRLTASPSNSTLTTQTIDQALNTFYTQDFPYAIKLDQLRDVYSFFTSPNVDTYPLDVNNNQGIRDPVYFEGIQGYFFKDRNAFFKMWPRYPTQFTQGPTNPDLKTFNFTLGQVPFLPTMVVIGGMDQNGNTIRIVDNGGFQQPNGNATTVGDLLFLSSNNVGDFVPPIPPTSPLQPVIPGPPNAIGTVNYVTGQFSFILPPGTTLMPSTTLTVWVSQYSPGRPYTLLFFNNQFTVRPVPDNVYKIELETYLTPTQFLISTDSPQLTQWWQYLAYGASMEILRERGDVQGVENLREGFMRQESLVLERQAVEEIGQRNTTIFTSQFQNLNYGTPQGWF